MTRESILAAIYARHGAPSAANLTDGDLAHLDQARFGFLAVQHNQRGAVWYSAADTIEELLGALARQDNDSPAGWSAPMVYCLETGMGYRTSLRYRCTGTDDTVRVVAQAADRKKAVAA